MPHWALSDSCTFSENSIYTHINSNGATTMDWSRIWKMNITPSVKTFVWKAAHSILPNSMRVAAKIPDINTTCTLCNEGEESLTHLFLQCNFATQVWMHLNFDMGYVTNGTNTFHEWLNSWFDDTDRGGYAMDWQVFCSIITWHIWKARCNMVFRKEKQNSSETARKIVKYINSFMNVNKLDYYLMQTLYYNP